MSLLKGVQEDDEGTIPVYDLAKELKTNDKEIAMAVDMDELHQASLDEHENTRKSMDWENNPSLMARGLKGVKKDALKAAPMVIEEQKTELEAEVEKLLDERTYSELEEVRIEERKGRDIVRFWKDNEIDKKLMHKGDSTPISCKYKNPAKSS